MRTGLLLALAAAILMAQPAAALEAYRIAFRNDCSTSARVALRHVDLNGNWITSGWFAIEPGTERLLVPTTNAVFYFTAEALGRVWNGTDEFLTVRDDPVPYGFQRIEIPSESFIDHLVTLDCKATYDIAPLHYIQVINRCSKPVELYLQFETLAGLTRAEGWFKLAPNRRGYLTRTKAADYYLYARADGVEWAGDHPVEVNPGTTYGFRRVGSGKIRTLTCS